MGTPRPRPYSHDRGSIATAITAGAYAGGVHVDVQERRLGSYSYKATGSGDSSYAIDAEFDSPKMDATWIFDGGPSGSDWWYTVDNDGYNATGHWNILSPDGEYGWFWSGSDGRFEDFQVMGPSSIGASPPPPSLSYEYGGRACFSGGVNVRSGGRDFVVIPEDILCPAVEETEGGSPTGAEVGHDPKVGVGQLFWIETSAQDAEQNSIHA